MTFVRLQLSEPLARRKGERSFCMASANAMNIYD